MKSEIRTVFFAALIDTAVTLLLFIAVKAWMRPPLEEILGVAILLLPVVLPFALWPFVRLWTKLSIGAVSLLLSIVGMFAIALALFGDSL